MIETSEQREKRLKSEEVTRQERVKAYHRAMNLGAGALLGSSDQGRLEPDTEKKASIAPVPTLGKFDKKTYQRNYMRMKRAAAKLKSST
jgi:hypothetical protein